MLLRTLGVVTIFGFSLFLTRNFDAKIIGQYDFIQKILLVLSSICMLGTDQSILYFTGILKSTAEIGKLKIVYKKIVVLIFTSSLFVLLLFLIVGKSLVHFFFNNDSSYLLIFKAIIILFFYSLTVFNIETIRALGRVYLAELFRNTFKYVSVIFGAIILFYSNKEKYLTDTFLIGFVVLAFVTTTIIFSILKKKEYTSVENKSESRFSYSSIASKSYPMAISNLAIFLMMTFDIVLLKKYKGDEVVAYYGIAIKIVSVLFMISNSVFISVSLKIAQQFSDNSKSALLNTMRQSSRIIFVLTLPIVIIVCFYAEHILGFFGTNYTQAKQAFLILLVGQLIASAFGLTSIYLNMTGRQKIFQRILILAVLLNFILNIILIPLYSLTGAAMAFVTSLLFWNCITAVIVYKKDKLLIILH